MTEWWQKNDGDVPVPIPRRDVVPESGLSDPRDVIPNPELSSFIPEWRPRRRVIAILVTVVCLGIVIWSIVDVVRLVSTTCPVERVLGIVDFIFVAIRILASAIAVRSVWRWANQKDPRDIIAREGQPNGLLGR